ncbi:uncharacterized protein LY79DRAFT_580691 [Colletotrichum navitas]|uniref:Life-span regulatory factor n=1 Tax=Colletotrichum navitas TaxID=681940 RepID=A0AAD8V4L4_9PEZI|nr:uncharacterized protein LY79DRAFT_580691 [Colletotrichum navitas]KAK1586060.1 hypothetical protein LY79DRAFT_580691 [Colletotrichum navitas]
MHHTRRKSGNTSMSEKTVTASDPSRYGKRPSTLTRRQTPQKLGKSPRDRERELQDSWDDQRESFPQFCMTCEKQFVPQDANFLYCSEACRKHDQQSASTGRSHSHAHMGNYPFYAIGNPEPRDIVPRASPSRPNSMHFSPPTTPGTATSAGGQYSSAVSALRSLSIRPPSPPSPSTSHPSLWPFTKSTTNSPGTSYNRGTNSFFPATYDGGYAANAHAYNYSSSGMDRPLPTRRPTGPGYSRPKSIELVTPMVGR